MRVDQIIAGVGVPLWQHRREFVDFCEWIRAEGIRSILEIGTGYGGSAYVFGEVTGHGRIVTVDFDGQGAARVDPKRRRVQPNPNFVQIIGDSRTDEIEREVQRYAPFDLVYFDTEHAYEDCLDNYRRYGPMASRFLAQHDINMDEEHWKDAGIPRCYRQQVAIAGGAHREFIAPDPDPRFPRWGGIGVITAVGWAGENWQ